MALSNVVKSFGPVHVIKGIDLEIKSGEFVVFVGPSGCGKSTLLRMIAGLESITAGNISIGGTVVNDLPPRLRDIAMVFQDYALYPHKSVFENMAFGLRLRKLPEHEIRTRVNDAASILQIDHLYERKPRELSGGQRQRVAMGRAIVRQPKAFLFDEPLSNLDALLRAEMRVEMGNLVQYDTPDGIYNRPAAKFVAGFTGSPPMNFAPCRIGEGGRIVHLKGGIDLPVPPRCIDEVARHIGREMTFGLRPEHVGIAAAGGAEAHRVDGRVLLVEPLGAETLALIKLGTSDDAAEMTGRFEPDAHLRVGQNLAVALELNHMHLFDTKSGLAIRGAGW